MVDLVLGNEQCMYMVGHLWQWTVCVHGGPCPYNEQCMYMVDPVLGNE